MNPTPLVALIVVNWNGRAVTLECLESLRKVSYPTVRIVLVDNASTDGSVAAIRRAFSDITLLEMGENLRFAGGSNAGIRHALTQGAELVVLLNNDTIAAPDFLTHLVQRVQSDPNIGMVAPKIYYAGDPKRLWYAGGRIFMWTGTMAHTGIRKLDTGQYDTAGDIDYATGCCVLVRRQVIDTVGVLDESFHMYAEDADWSMRARKAGFRIVFEPRSHVWHRISVSSGGHLSRYKLKNKFTGNFLFFARHASWYHWLVFPWMNLLANSLAAVRYLIARTPPDRPEGTVST